MKKPKSRSTQTFWSKSAKVYGLLLGLSILVVIGWLVTHRSPNFRGGEITADRQQAQLQLQQMFSNIAVIQNPQVIFTSPVKTVDFCQKNFYSGVYDCTLTGIEFFGFADPPCATTDSLLAHYPKGSRGFYFSLSQEICPLTHPQTTNNTLLYNDASSATKSAQTLDLFDANSFLHDKNAQSVADLYSSNCARQLFCAITNGDDSKLLANLPANVATIATFEAYVTYYQK